MVERRQHHIHNVVVWAEPDGQPIDQRQHLVEELKHVAVFEHAADGVHCHGLRCRFVAVAGVGLIVVPVGVLTDNALDALHTIDQTATFYRTVSERNVFVDKIRLADVHHTVEQNGSVFVEVVDYALLAPLGGCEGADDAKIVCQRLQLAQNAIDHSVEIVGNVALLSRGAALRMKHPLSVFVVNQPRNPHCGTLHVRSCGYLTEP